MSSTPDVASKDEDCCSYAGTNVSQWHSQTDAVSHLEDFTLQNTEQIESILPQNDFHIINADLTDTFSTSSLSVCDDEMNLLNEFSEV